MAEGVLVVVVLAGPSEFKAKAHAFLKELSLLLRSVARLMVDEGGVAMVYPWDVTSCGDGGGCALKSGELGNFLKPLRSKRAIAG